MRVLLIDVNCKFSSTGKIVYDLFQNLKANGHEAAVCYGRGEEIKEDGIFKFGLDWETNVHAGLTRITGLNGCFSYFSTKRLLKFIEEYKPDVIHIHELHAYFVNQKPLIGYIKQHRIPLVWTFHCEYEYTGKCGYAYDCEKWKTECGNCPAIQDYPTSLWFDKTNKMFIEKKKTLQDLDFTIVTPSKWLANRVKLSFLKDKPLKVIHNGIDMENVFFPRSEDETNRLKKQYGLGKRKIVLSVAPNIMDERKGGQTVLQIAERMPDLQFVLVGTDENKNYSENVILIARTKDQNELAQWYSLADLFLICSKRENFPTTCLEALACGTPIVGIDAGGTRETAEEPFGVFVDDDRISTLISAIAIQVDKNFKKQDVREMAIENYSQDKMSNNYMEEYIAIYRRR